jgi:methylglutaconyl-CoA hydratase
LRDVGKRTIKALLAGGPNAQVVAKDLIFDVSGRPLDDKLVELTAGRIARLRATDEAQEGIAAFLEKRKPRWVKN